VFLFFFFFFVFFFFLFFFFFFWFFFFFFFLVFFFFFFFCFFFFLSLRLYDRLRLFGCPAYLFDRLQAQQIHRPPSESFVAQYPTTSRKVVSGKFFFFYNQEKPASLRDFFLSGPISSRVKRGPKQEPPPLDAVKGPPLRFFWVSPLGYSLPRGWRGRPCSGIPLEVECFSRSYFSLSPFLEQNHLGVFRVRPFPWIGMVILLFFRLFWSPVPSIYILFTCLPSGHSSGMASTVAPLCLSHTVGLLWEGLRPIPIVHTVFRIVRFWQ